MKVSNIGRRSRRLGNAGIASAALLGALLMGACTGQSDDDQPPPPERAACPTAVQGNELFQIASRVCDKSAGELVTEKQQPAQPTEGQTGANSRGCPATWQGGKWVLDKSTLYCLLPMKDVPGVYVVLAATTDLTGPPVAFVRREGSLVVMYLPSVLVQSSDPSQPTELVRLLVRVNAANLNYIGGTVVSPQVTAVRETGEKPAQVDQLIALVAAYRKALPTTEL